MNNFQYKLTLLFERMARDVPTKRIASRGAWLHITADKLTKRQVVEYSKNYKHIRKVIRGSFTKVSVLCKDGLVNFY